MAKRHSMHDGPLAALFKATERAEAAVEAAARMRRSTRTPRSGSSPSGRASSTSA